MLFLVGAVLAALLAWIMLKPRQIIAFPGETCLLYRGGKFLRELPAGAHWLFDPMKSSEVVRIPTIAQVMNAAMIEVISKDQFAFRVTVTAVVTIESPREFHENSPRYGQQISGYTMPQTQRLSQFDPTLSAEVLQAVAAHSLEEFLAAPAAALAPAVPALDAVMPGTRLDKILVTAVTLPPEIRKMFTEVERARREGLASLERARAEQASLRALANAARNFDGNPQLAQLRMLQVMESAKGAKTFILGDPGLKPALPPES